MKPKTAIIALIITAFLYACNLDSDLQQTLSHEDEIALKEMAESSEIALLYNDSLVLCYDSNWSLRLKYYYDSIYHHHISNYNQNNQAYSHNYTSDDHHHGKSVKHHHGHGGHDSEGDDHGEDDKHEHNIESHQKMDRLVEYHKGYHP